MIRPSIGRRWEGYTLICNSGKEKYSDLTYSSQDCDNQNRSAALAGRRRDILGPYRACETRMSGTQTVTASSGNVFADLGFANPEEELLRAKLAREIRDIMKRRKLTRAKAAVLLGLKAPDVSALVTGRAGEFSIDRLVRCLTRLDYEVDVVIRERQSADFR